MADSGNIETALIAKLAGDATLSVLMTNGVHIDVAPKGSTKFVIVSLTTSTDEPALGSARAYEDALYLVKAVAFSTSPASVKAAAARIDALLEQQPLTVTGFDHMVTRRVERVRYTEVDDVDADARWQHSGGRYQVMVSAA
jgi:hypothetical protein